MIYEKSLEDSKEKKGTKLTNKQPWLLCLIIIGCTILEHNSNHWLPSTLKTSAINLSEKFSVQFAKAHLLALTNLGPRVVGSHTTEILTPILLINSLKRIQELAPKNVRIEIDEQHPSSHFYIDFLGGINNVYSNVTNVIAKISWLTPQDGTKESNLEDLSSILINAHFDSVPGSPGAADDGIGVACMLEVLRVLSVGPALRRPVVFLFNGAEENNHQAAHGFITQHKWAKQVKYLINLEAIGSGGHELVFQCNSGWLAGFYASSSPFPHTQVIAHELFKNFLYRVASTDWSTIIKYGSPGMKGIDTAYIENGYVYHTSYDNIGAIPDGTYLNTGENLLQLTKALSTAAVVNENRPATPAEKDSDEHAVFFDILGFTVIVYTGVYVTIYHSLAVLFGLFTVYKLSQCVDKELMSKENVVRLLTDELIGIWLPALLTALLGLVMWLVAPMRWYSGGVYVGCLMYLPVALFTTIITRSHLTTRSHSHYLLRQIAVILMFCVISAPMIALNVMSAFIFCLWIVFTSLASLVQLRMVQNNNKTNKVKASDSSNSLCETISPSSSSGKLTHTSNIRPSSVSSAQFSTRPQAVYLLCIAPMILTWIQSIHLTFTMLIPLLGKSGTTIPSDPLLGALFGLLISIPSGCVLNNEIQAPIRKETTRNCFGALVVLYVIIVLTYTSSYSNDRPKRLWIQHIERFTQDSHSAYAHPIKSDLSVATPPEDFGVWVSAFDSNGMAPLKSLHLPLLDSAPVNNEQLSTHCSDSNGDCYFSFPWYFPVAEAIKDSVYLATDNKIVASAVNTVDKQRPAIGAKERLTLTATSEAITNEYCQKYKCDESIVKLITPTHEYRLVNITLYGPSHMHLVVRDNERGARLPLWRVNGNVNALLKTDRSLSHLLNFESAAPIRAEGVHYFQIGFGTCSAGHCLMSLQLVVKGDKPVQIAAYGHYVDQSRDKAITALVESLPQWSKGAEWTNFPSVLIRDSV